MPPTPRRLRTLVVPALLLVAACTAPSTPLPGPEAETPAAEPIATTGFDPGAWLAGVRNAETEAEQVELSAALLDAVDWRTACGEDDPTALGRGTLSVLPLAEEDPLAEITCQHFAYQSTFALVDVRPNAAPRLVRALGVREDGTVSTDTTASFFGVLAESAMPGRFEVLTKSAGHGGCGTLATYRLLATGGAAVEQIRAHSDCTDALLPDAWPVTYAGS